MCGPAPVFSRPKDVTGLTAGPHEGGAHRSCGRATQHGSYTAMETVSADLEPLELVLKASPSKRRLHRVVELVAHV